MIFSKLQIAVISKTYEKTPIYTLFVSVPYASTR